VTTVICLQSCTWLAVKPWRRQSRTRIPIWTTWGRLRATLTCSVSATFRRCIHQSRLRRAPTSCWLVSSSPPSSLRFLCCSLFRESDVGTWVKQSPAVTRYSPRSRSLWPKHLADRGFFGWLLLIGMGDHLQLGIPPRYVTSHSGQLSLAIPPWR